MSSIDGFIATIHPAQRTADAPSWLRCADASHITQGVSAVLILGPGLFVASKLFGTLARRTGSILPGMIIHVLGDLARVYFGVLKADGSQLFVS